ncbi:MAG: serine--tRNA ligase [Candidatus Absconditabacterales bacterium]|nr:serine--tRNA ligase [Candidatus Absconditabacterales bacterium]
MLDINLIRDNIEVLRRLIREKRVVCDIDRLVHLDDKRKIIQKTIDEQRFQQKQLSGSKDTIEEAKMIKTIIHNLEAEYQRVMDEYTELLWSVPNLVADHVVSGQSENDNVVEAVVGHPRSFSFKPLDHQELGEKLGILDKEQASKVSGSRFFYLLGAGAQLQYALINRVFSCLTDKQWIADCIARTGLSMPVIPFTIVIPPTIISQDTMHKMGRLYPKDDRYCLDDDNQVLIGSAEHSLGPLHMDQLLDLDQAPKRYIAVTSSYRREAGTYGKDTKGILRTHEFHKLEMETFSTPDQGMNEHRLLIEIQKTLVGSLGLPYRVINKCTADVGIMNFSGYDIETRFPAQETYRETHTADYMTDYQARRLGIKTKMADGSKVFVHMNDATALALGRIIAAILENYQQENGTVVIPHVLCPFLGGKSLITSLGLE